MKKPDLIYWLSTLAISLMMFNSAYMCFASPFMKASLAHLGFPAYFRLELGVAKIVGALAISLPAVPGRLKEWAYAGFFFMFTSGILAHLLVGDPATMWGAGLVALAVLTTSYLRYRQYHLAA